MSADRIKVNTPATVSVTFYADGSPASDSPVTVTVTRGDDSVLVAGAATANPSTGVYTYTLPAQPAVNHLTLTWTGGTQIQQTQVEIVGGFYLSEAEVRSLNAAFASGGSYSDADIRRVISEVEDAIEADAGVAFVRRYARDPLDGEGRPTLMLEHMHPRVLRSVRTYTDATTYSALSAGEVTNVVFERSGKIRRWTGVFAAGIGNIVVEYEHGIDAPPPLIRSAARALVKSKLLATTSTSDLENVRSLSVEGYSTSWFEGVRTGSKTADDLVDQWKRSTTPAGVAIA